MNESLIYNINQLRILLEVKYGEKISIDSLYILMGSIKGTFESKNFGITFEKNRYLILTSSSYDVLSELTSFLTEIMGNCLPICSYDLLTNGNLFPTIEWDVLDPEKRINDIIRGKAYHDGEKVLNFKVYDNQLDFDNTLQRTIK